MKKNSGYRFLRAYTAINAICISAALLSAYAYVLSNRVEEDDEYEAICDITENISCSKGLRSEYNRGFGLIAPLLGEDSFLNLSNGLIGVFFYIIMATTSLWSGIELVLNVQIALYTTAVALTLWLGYAFFAVLQNFCALCITFNVLNITCLILTLIARRNLPLPSPSKTTAKKSAPAKKGRSKKA